MNQFYYKAYGLTILSHVFFPEFVKTESHKPDIFILYGSVPDNLNYTKIVSSYCQISYCQFLLKLPGIARYLVSNGKTIVIEPYPSADKNNIRAYLTGIVIGMALHQRKLLVLHGSAIALPDRRAVIFVAHSGNGKSTLAASFYKRGYAVLADDICAINIKNDIKPSIDDTLSYVKLTRKSIDKLNIKIAEELPNKKDKYTIYFKKSISNHSYKIDRVYEITADDTSSFSIKKLSGMDKFTVIKVHSFNEWALPALGLQETHFNLCTSFNKLVKVSRVIRPSFGFRIDELTELLLSDLNKS